MSYGLQTWDAAGRLTFDSDMALIRQETVLAIAAWTSGSIDMSPYLGSSAAIRFVPVDGDFIPDRRPMPYVTWSGNTMSWRADNTSVILTVAGFVL